LPNYKRMRRAFTLIELLVVIAIIAILAAILFPVFAQAKNSARKVTAISNLKQAGLSTMLYLGDYDETLPPLLRTTNTTDPLAAQFPSACFGPMCRFGYPILLFPYSKNTEMFYDPTDRQDDPTILDLQGKGRFDRTSSLFWYNFGAYPSFGYNRKYLNDVVVSAMGTFTYYGKSVSTLGAPAETLMFADATGKDIVSPGRPVVSVPIGYHRVDAPSFWNSAAVFPNATSQGQLWGRYEAKRVITAWVDGHATTSSIAGLRGPGTTVAEIDRYWNGLGSN